MKKLIILLLVPAILLTFSSCTGSERLKNMAIVQGLALDIQGEQILATIQYLDLSKGSGKNEQIGVNITAIVSAKGGDIDKAIKNAEKQLPDKLFFGQNKIIAVSEEFEKRHTEQLKSYLVKNRQSRPDVLIFKCRGRAREIIKNAQKNTRVPADSIYKQLEKNKQAVTCSDYLAGDSLKYYN